MASTITLQDLIDGVRETLNAWPTYGTLKNAVGASLTTIEFIDDLEADFVKGKELLELENEVMRVIDKPADGSAILRVIRGYKRTTPVSHGANLQVKVYPSWGWTDKDIKSAIRQAIKWLKPHAWTQAISADFTVTKETHEQTVPSATGVSYPDGNPIIRLERYNDGDSLYYPMRKWTISGDRIKFGMKFSSTTTMRIIYAAFQGQLATLSSDLDDDDFEEPIVLYSASLLLNSLKTDRIKYAEFSASLNDRASDADQLIRMAYDLRNQAIVSREKYAKPLPAFFMSTYRDPIP